MPRTLLRSFRLALERVRHSEAPIGLPHHRARRSILPPVATWHRDASSRRYPMQAFYSIKEVCRLLHVSRETLRRWEQADWFPKRVSFTQHRRGRKGYLASEVHGWIEARQSSR